MDKSKVARFLAHHVFVIEKHAQDKEVSCQRSTTLHVVTTIDDHCGCCLAHIRKKLCRKNI